MSRSVRKVLRESDIQRQILDWLKRKRIFHWRNNAGAMKGSYKGKNWFVRFGLAGMPDIIAVRPQYFEADVIDPYQPREIVGQFVGIECKAPGKEQSQAQREFQTELERAGGLYILAHSLEDVIRVLG